MPSNGVFVCCQSGCDGKRNVIPHVRIGEFTDKVIRDGMWVLSRGPVNTPCVILRQHFNTGGARTDYNFLENVLRSTESARRRIQEYGTLAGQATSTSHPGRRKPNKRAAGRSRPALPRHLAIMRSVVGSGGHWCPCCTQRPH